MRPSFREEDASATFVVRKVRWRFRAPALPARKLSTSVAAAKRKGRLHSDVGVRQFPFRFLGGRSGCRQVASSAVARASIVQVAERATDWAGAIVEGLAPRASGAVGSESLAQAPRLVTRGRR